MHLKPWVISLRISERQSGPTLLHINTFTTSPDVCYMAVLWKKVSPRAVEKNILFDGVSASFLSSSDFLSQSRLNKGPHRHRIKRYCLVGDLISLHHKRPSQPCHGNLSHFFVRSIFLKFLLLCCPPHNLLLWDKAAQHNERGAIGNGKSMDTVINLGPTPPDSRDSAPAAKETLVGPAG